MRTSPISVGWITGRISGGESWVTIKLTPQIETCIKKATKNLPTRCKSQAQSISVEDDPDIWLHLLHAYDVRNHKHEIEFDIKVRTQEHNSKLLPEKETPTDIRDIPVCHVTTKHGESGNLFLESSDEFVLVFIPDDDDELVYLNYY